MKQSIKKRIEFHKKSIREIEEYVFRIQKQYEIETRKGLDEYQLKELLLWRKTQIAACEGAKIVHTSDINWLERLYESHV